jgi:hypothetical protein
MSARVSVLSVFVFAVAVLQARCDGFYVNALSRVVVPDGGSALRSAVGGGFALGVPVGE